MKINASLHRLAATAALLCCGAAHAADAPAGCQYVRIAELPLRYLGPGMQVATDGMVNDQPASMLVDTGAFHTALSRTLTERLDLPLRMTGQYSEGIGGYSRLFSAPVSQFSVGPAKSAKGWMTVIGETGHAPAFDVLVGAPFLLQADMEISLAEKKLRFYRPRNCEKSFLGYWSKDVFEVPFEFHDDNSPNPHITVEVNGQKMKAFIDSGATTTSIDANAARRAGVKLDGPGVVRLADAGGVGEAHVPRWSARVDSIVIGPEKIVDGEIGVLAAGALPNKVDMLIGDDYLRAHRVLFAMSQKKLYISYVGGDVFKQRRSLEPWLLKEAEGGNPDAQLLMADLYAAGQGVAKDPAQAAAWLARSAAAGHPQAKLALGRKLYAEKRYADAALQLRQALDKLPAERFGALDLYLARLRTGEADVGKRELEATFARSDKDAWPSPVADFYLGRIDAAALLGKAGTDAKQAKARTCVATDWMHSLYEATGNQAQADAARASLQANCQPSTALAQAN